MRTAILGMLTLALTGMGPASSGAAEPQENAMDGYATFGDLAKKDASKKARDMAKTDFARNVYRILVAGKPAGKVASEEYLANKYGVQVTPIAGCLISEGIEGAIDGYNSTMRPLLNRKFGHDIFKEAEDASRK